jgi:hypothetical protein
MTLQQFDLISKHEDCKYLLLNGVCIGDRITDEDAHVLLFQVTDKYVEVFFSLERDRLLYTRSFEGIEELEPYLGMIDGR